MHTHRATQWAYMRHDFPQRCEALSLATPLIKIAWLVLYPLSALYLMYYLFFVDHLGLSLVNVVFVMIYCVFMASAIVYTRNVLYSNRSLKTTGQFDLSLDEVISYAKRLHAPLPRIAIFVPARNEGYVIENTVRRLVKMDYVKCAYGIFVITDQRELDDDVHPVTKHVVGRIAREVNQRYGTNLVQYIEVPTWYSGVFGSNERTYEKSTKGRALNYALQTIASSQFWQDIDFIAVVDADGRLHVDVLKEVAYNSLRFGSKLLQGPVFQVSNLSDVSLVGILAALELAFHHLTELTPRLMRNKFQFLAGTNYFIDKTLLVQCGAWNQYALVEDAELAMRLYIQKKATATWLSCFEIEQTPPSFRVYRRQRERWVRGQLELLPYILRSALPRQEKASYLSKVILSQFRFIFDTGFPIVAILYVVLGLIPRLDLIISIILLSFLVLSFLIWDIYGLTYRRLVPYLPASIPASRKMMVILQSVRLFLFVPFMICIQITPRMIALSKYIFAVKQTSWYKTERTRERINE